MPPIQIRPFGKFWEVFEGEGIQPRFPTREGAITYALQRAGRREVHVIDASGAIVQRLPGTGGAR